jgi:hypothetical protein
MGDALAVAAQDFLAAGGRVAIAPPGPRATNADVDIPSAGAVPVVDGYADPRLAAGPVALPMASAADVDVDVGALLCVARTLLARAGVGVAGAHVTAAVALILAGARAVATLAALAGLGTTLGAGLALRSGCVIALLCLVHERAGIACGRPGGERRDLVSTYKREHRRSGTQHQQVSHRNHPCSAFRLPESGAWRDNVGRAKRLPC